MKLKESFVTHKNKGDYMMIDATGEFSGLVHSNATTAFIVGGLKNDTTREEIIAKMLDKYDAPKSKISQDVDRIISSLKSIGAIDE